MSAGRLSVVAVPIGNLEDITLRALRVLREADRVACEDTRRTGKLLSLLAVEAPPLISVHDHNEAERIPRILRALEEGESVALVSDAGTPAISDPGFKLVRAVLEAGFEVVPIPGVSAVITALCAAGLPTDRFRFLGFLPQKREARRRALEAVAGAEDTLVLYESPHRLRALLADALQVLGDRPAVIARELTKRYEEFRRGPLSALVEDPGVVRGEIVVLIGGRPEEAAPDEASLEETMRALIAEGWSSSRAAKEAAKRTGASRDEAYRMSIALKREAESAPE